MPNESRAWVDRTFRHHPPTGDEEELRDAIRVEAWEFAVFILENCPECPEREIAFRKLQEVIMWAYLSVAMGSDRVGPETPSASPPS